jgi:hypothetical protein
MKLQRHSSNDAQAAELYTALVALKTVKEFSFGTDIKLVILKTSSPYLFQHMYVS